MQLRSMIRFTQIDAVRVIMELVSYITKPFTKPLDSILARSPGCRHTWGSTNYLIN